MQSFPNTHHGTGTYSALVEDYREIPLTRGYSVRISEQDAELALGLPLFALVTKRGGVYAAWKPSYSKKTFLLHRAILNASKGVWVDHRNHDTLDCTRGNIRLCTPAENGANCRRSKPNTSGFRGVIPCGKRYRGKAVASGKTYFTHSFPTPLEAAIARDSLALELHQQYAVLNFPVAACAAAQ